jgi:hypothetical protein
MYRLKRIKPHTLVAIVAKLLLATGLLFLGIWALAYLKSSGNSPTYAADDGCKWEKRYFLDGQLSFFQQECNSEQGNMDFIEKSPDTVAGKWEYPNSSGEYFFTINLLEKDPAKNPLDV